MASQSILLPSRSLYTPSLSSSTSSASSLSTSPAPRHIRFAPLPDPRRAVLVTDDGAELPIPCAEENAFSTSLLLAAPAVVADDACDAPHDAYASSTISTSSSASASAASTPRTATPSEYSPVSSVGSSPVIVAAALPTKAAALPPSSPRPDPSLPAASTWPKPRSLNLLRQFKKSSASSSGSSSLSLTPTPSIDTTGPTGTGHTAVARKSLSLSTEEILTLGTINLFRTSSRESHDSGATATAAGWGLARWASGPSANPKDSSLLGGSPLARTQSTQSYKSRSKGLFGALSGGAGSSVSLADARAPPPSTKTPPATPSRLKGTRMLNGRVYGARRNPNLFASARDEEPEFVEWGYGGMGSVKGARSAGVAGANGGVNWSRLHGESDSRAAPAVVDDDDGSGMGWVKRRKEERERKAREEKERAQREALEAEKEKEREAERSDSQMSTPTPTRSSSMMDGGFALLGAAPAPVAFESTTINDNITPTFPASSSSLADADGDAISTPAPPLFSAEPDAISPATAAAAADQTPSVVEEPEHEREKEHVAVLVPVPVRPVRHHRVHSRTLSIASEKGVSLPVAQAEETPAHARTRSDSSVSASESESGSGSGSESESDEREEEDEDDAEEEVEAEERRKTMLGAGVEKVMRHTHKE